MHESEEVASDMPKNSSARQLRAVPGRSLRVVVRHPAPRRRGAGRSAAPSRRRETGRERAAEAVITALTLFLMASPFFCFEHAIRRGDTVAAAP